MFLLMINNPIQRDYYFCENLFHLSVDLTGNEEEQVP